jgi:hypothetical protein
VESHDVVDMQGETDFLNKDSPGDGASGKDEAASSVRRRWQLITVLVVAGLVALGFLAVGKPAENLRKQLRGGRYLAGDNEDDGDGDSSAWWAKYGCAYPQFASNFNCQKRTTVISPTTRAPSQVVPDNGGIVTVVSDAGSNTPAPLVVVATTTPAPAFLPVHHATTTLAARQAVSTPTFDSPDADAQSGPQQSDNEVASAEVTPESATPQNSDIPDAESLAGPGR